MREEHLPYVSDPLTSQTFQVDVFEKEGAHILSGILRSRDNWYPIIDGIPRVLVGKLRTTLLQGHHAFLEKFKEKLSDTVRSEWQTAINAITDFNTFVRHQKRTAESFSYEWKYIYKENIYEKNNFYHFAGPYVTEENIKGKATIDIGCGSGRFTKWAALSGTTVSFGTDLGESVEVAYQMTKDLPNACIVQADIYHMPFRGVFDLAYSIGVLHHLPKPQEGFSRLPAVLKSGGEMVIWVYNRRRNARALYFYEPLRTILKKLPKPLLFKLSYIPGFLVHIINQLTLLLQKLNFPIVAKKIPFSYYAHFPFNMKLNDAFDVLATPKSNYYRVEEIRKWFADSHLQNIEAYEHPEAGITCKGIYGS